MSGVPRPKPLLTAVSVVTALLVSGCALFAAAAVPPPPGVQAERDGRAAQPSYGAAAVSGTPAQRALPPPALTYITPEKYTAQPSPALAAPTARTLPRSTAQPVRSGPVPATEGYAQVPPPPPAIYRATPPAPRVVAPLRQAPAATYPAAYQPAMPRVSQAEPGPALALDFRSNPAWQRAVIPPESRAATVGRMPAPAATPGFTIGAGDTVQIDVLGRSELSAKGNVSGDGRVTVALVGPVDIGGLTPVAAAERIAQAYRDGQYLVAPQVTVTLIDYQSQLLTVLGEVRSPGRFPMRTRLSVLDGIALAGGTSEQGASTAYLLRPENSVVTRYEIDLEALIQVGAGQQYFEMLAGDTLVVPKTEVFYIYGEAKNPNAYKLKPGMTVIQALSLAGGLTDKGSDKRIDIRRRDDEGRLRTLAASLNEPLLPDDVVYVRERLF